MAHETIELTEVQAILHGLSSPTDEEFVQAVRAYSDGAVASAAALVAHQAKAGAINVQDFGAVGNNVADDTIPIQSAIDYAHSLGAVSAGVPVVLFPPSAGYLITDTIEWKACHLVGAYPNSSVRIFWNGAAGGTAIEKWSTAHTGAASFALMEGINFRSGTSEPATWLDWTTLLSGNTSIDKYAILDRVHFGGSSGDAVKTSGFINCHWTDLRFDNIGGYAIRVTAASGTNLSSFVLDRFTYDHSRSTDLGNGFLMIDNTADSSNLGTVRISNGRIEVNTAWEAPQAIVHYVLPAAPAATRSLGLHVADVTYDGNAAMASDVLLYRDTTNTTGSESLMLSNVRQLGLSALCGGTWPGAFTFPPLQSNYGFLAMNSGGNEMIASQFRPIVRQTYAASNVATDRTYDANATTTDELADVLGTLIADLRTIGLIL